MASAEVEAAVCAILGLRDVAVYGVEVGALMMIRSSRLYFIEMTRVTSPASLFPAGTRRRGSGGDGGHCGPRGLPQLRRARAGCRQDAACVRPARVHPEGARPRNDGHVQGQEVRPAERGEWGLVLASTTGVNSV